MDSESPDSLIEEVFVSGNGESDYIKINRHKLTPSQVWERIKLYEQSPHPAGSFSESMYKLYSEAFEILLKKRSEKGLHGTYSQNPRLNKDKRLNLKQLIS